MRVMPMCGCVQPCATPTGTGQGRWGGEPAQGRPTAALLTRLLSMLPGVPASAGEARDFVQACLNRDEKARPTAEQLLEHPWLQVGGAGVPQARLIMQA